MPKMQVVSECGRQGGRCWWVRCCSILVCKWNSLRSWAIVFLQSSIPCCSISLLLRIKKLVSFSSVLHGDKSLCPIIQHLDRHPSLAFPTFQTIATALMLPRSPTPSFLKLLLRLLSSLPFTSSHVSRDLWKVYLNTHTFLHAHRCTRPCRSKSTGSILHEQRGTPQRWG